MSTTASERLLPWSGAVAGLAWIAHGGLKRFGIDDQPSGASVEVINDHLTVNIASQGALIVMGVALLFFSAATRGHLRSEASDDTGLAFVASAGWIVVVAAISQMVVWGWALINGAADSGDQSAAAVLGYAEFFGWAGLGIGLSTAFVATGLGGWRQATLPRWFAATSVVLGVLAALGNAGIPPGGLVTYVLLPFWLLAASVVMTTRHRASRSVDIDAG